MTYQSESPHPSNYSEQSHYTTSSPSSQSYATSNSGQSYGQPVNQFTDMYDTCSPYAANIPSAIRQPIPSSNLKYWNSDQMSHNSHNYNQGISPQPPPLMSRNPNLRSPPLQSSHCNASNHYNGTPVVHRPSSRSPQDWSRNVMSPSATPSPLPSLSSHTTLSRSPSHVSSQQFSPSHSSQSVSDVSPSATKGQTGIAFNDQNHNSSHTSASNPLQSLQKMVTPIAESGNANLGAAYNGSVEMSSNSSQKNYSGDNNGNTDPDSPYPTYYNLDQNRLCTPPHTSSNPMPNDIPTKRKGDYISSVEPSIETNDNELKKCEINETNDTDSDLIYSNLDNSKASVVRQLSSPNSTKDTVLGINGGIPHKQTNPSLANSDVSSDLSQEVIPEHMNPPVICKRTESRDSMQSSDSETVYNNETRPQTMWQMDKDYYSRYPDQKNWSQWPQTNVPQSNVPPAIVSQNNYMGGRPPVGPNINSIPYQPSYRHDQCGAGSWTSPVSSSRNANPNQDFTPPKNMGSESGKKKRGRPFGSKNRRNSDDNNSEKNPSNASTCSKKSRKSVTEEIGINTSVSIDAHGFDQLTVVNPLKQMAKRKKTVGPFIRMEKTKGGLTTSYEIVNTSSKPEDEKDIKTKTQLTKTESLKHHIRRPSLLVSSKKTISNLSSSYDINSADKTWVCALCHNGPHFKGLGDLFGPYFVALDDKNKAQTTSTSATSAPNASNTRSHTSLMDSIDKTIDSVLGCEPKAAKRGRKRKSESSDSRPKLSAGLSNDDTEACHPQTNATEVWVHEDCLVWSNNVYLIGHRIKNLEEVIIESTENVSYINVLMGNS